MAAAEARAGQTPVPGPAVEGIELRIHGVGGSTPHGLLGESDPDAVELIGGYPDCGIWARKSNRSIRGFVWGPLTSGSRFQALWILLFPFTLLNAAGWMHPKAAPGRSLRVTTIRFVVEVLGVALTVTWVLWLADIVVDQIAHQAARDLGAADSGWLLPTAAVLTVLALIAFAVSRFPAYLVVVVLPLPAALVAAHIDEPKVRVVLGTACVLLGMATFATIAGLTRRRFERQRFDASGEGQRAPAGRRRWHEDERLDSPAFFDHPGDSARLLAVHVAAVVISAGYVGARAWGRVDEPALSFGSGITAVVAVQFALLVLLLCLTLRALSWRRGWRVAGPAMAATIALMVSNGVFAGVALLVRRRLDLATAPGSEMAFLDVYAIVVLGSMAAVVLLWLPFFLRASPLDLSLPPVWRKKVAQRRQLARIFRHIDLPLSAAGLAMLVAGLAVGAARLDRRGWDPRDWSLDTDGQVGWAVAAGEWALPLMALAVPLLIRLGIRSTGVRRNVGNVWDVLSFWPRRFHPLGVRPYPERAVPILQEHLAAALQESPRIVVSAHSQGTVLAFAALAGLPPSVPRDRVTLVTYGSPLSRLHGNFFPHYFDGPLLLALQDQLRSWCNLYRRTDHIGQTVFGGSPADRELPDPSTTAPSPVEGETPLEVDIPPLSRISGHNDYRREHDLKVLVLAQRRGGDGPTATSLRDTVPALAEPRTPEPAPPPA